MEGRAVDPRAAPTITSPKPSPFTSPADETLMPRYASGAAIVRVPIPDALPLNTNAPPSPGSPPGDDTNAMAPTMTSAKPSPLVSPAPATLQPKYPVPVSCAFAVEGLPLAIPDAPP